MPLKARPGTSWTPTLAMRCSRSIGVPQMIRTVALFDKCRMDLASLGTPMTLRTKDSQSLLAC